jgi:DNA end-binding protein Ku
LHGNETYHTRVIYLHSFSFIMPRSTQKTSPVELSSVEESEEQTAPPLRASWSGVISLGLVNIPVKAIPLIRDRSIHFRMIHEKCETPISYKKICEKGEEVPDSEIIYGYELTRGEYVLLKKEEINEVKPESSSVIRLDSFIDFLEIDPHYFEKTYLLVPDRSEEPYSLLRSIMKKKGKAAIGMVTMFSRERIVLIHHYHNAVVATTMHYEDEVLDPGIAPQIAQLPTPSGEELALAGEILERLTAPVDLGKYHDHYREQLEELIAAKQKGERVRIAPKKPKAEAKNLMEALRKTAESLE